MERPRPRYGLFEIGRHEPVLLARSDQKHLLERVKEKRLKDIDLYVAPVDGRRK